jgi:hypothetical protein
MRLARWRIVGVATAAAAVALSCAGAAPGAATDMATVRGDAARTAAVAGGAVPPLTRAWSYTLKPGDDDELLSTLSRPLVAGGMVFLVFDRVIALDARTGAVRWTRPSYAAGLAFDGGRLFVHGDDGVTAVDPASGATLWHRDVVPAAWQAADAPPVAADGRVFVVDPRAESPRVVALDQATGAVLWDRPFSNSVAIGPPSHANSKVYISLGETGLLILDPATGAPLNTPSGGPLQTYWGTPVTITGGRAFDFWNWDGSSTIYDPNTGAPQGTLPTQHINPTADERSFAWVVVHQQTNMEVDVSATLDEPVRWWADLPRFGTGDLPEPFIAGPVLYTGDSEGRVVGLALANGNRVFCDRLGTQSHARNWVAAGGDVVVAVWAGKVVGYRAAPVGAKGLNCPGDPPYLHVEHEPVPWIYSPWNGNTPPGPEPNPELGPYYGGGYPADRPYRAERDTEEPPPVAESLAEPIPGPVGGGAPGGGPPSGGGAPSGGGTPGTGPLSWAADPPVAKAAGAAARSSATRPTCVRAGRRAIECTLRASGTRAVLVRLRHGARTLASATAKPQGGIVTARLRFAHTPPSGRWTLLVGRGAHVQRWTVTVARR